MEFYRYYDVSNGEDIIITNIILVKFYLIKKTPKGYWISSEFQKKRWINKTAKKRYAYPTKKKALNNFIKRKEQQKSILFYQLEQAKQALSQAKRLNENMQ